MKTNKNYIYYLVRIKTVEVIKSDAMETNIDALLSNADAVIADLLGST